MKTLSSGISKKDVETYLDQIKRKEEEALGATGNLVTKLTRDFDRQFDEHRFLESHEHIKRTEVDCWPDWDQADEQLFRESADSLRKRGQRFTEIFREKLQEWKDVILRALEEERVYWAQRAQHLEGELRAAENSEARRQQLIERIPRLQDDIQVLEVFWKRAQIKATGSEAATWTVGTDSEVGSQGRVSEL